jgi:hypothetical protein
VATLLDIRTALNGEIGVTVDAETTPWTVAVRNQAIADGYASLWRNGIWKPLKQDLATVTDASTYALTAIRRLDRVELLDTSLRLLEAPRAIVEDDGAAGWQLRLTSSVTIAAGYTMRVRGWGPYISAFANDAATDDLPDEHARLPRLKAKAILWRAQLGLFARYGERQAIPPEMSMTIDQLLGMIAAAEREFEEEVRRLSNLRPRSGQARRV